MSRERRQQLFLGVIVLALGAVVIWAISVDVQTGIVETVRRRRIIGDALAPAVAAGTLLVAGVLLLLERPSGPVQISRESWLFLAAASAILALSLIVMRWTGPGLVELLRLLGADLPEYRQLRATRPWSWTGYVAGGAVLVGGLISLTRLRPSWRALALGLAVATALAAAYDLPFRNLILPPNGDL